MKAEKVCEKVLISFSDARPVQEKIGVSRADLSNYRKGAWERVSKWAKKKIWKYYGISQNNLVIWHILKYGKITQWDSAMLYGCWRLGARIHNLKGQGLKIKNVGKQYGVYTL